MWSPGGIKVLGTQLGSAKFEQETSNQLLQDERKLWEALPWIPDGEDVGYLAHAVGRRGVGFAFSTLNGSHSLGLHGRTAFDFRAIARGG